MTRIPAYEALQQMAYRIPDARHFLEDAARELRAAVEDKDGVVGPDEHFKITTALISAERAVGEVAKRDTSVGGDLQLITDLKLDIYKQTDEAEGWFHAFKPMVDDGKSVMVQGPEALDRRIGDAANYVTYIPRGQWEALLGPHFQLRSDVAPGEAKYDVDDNDYVFSAMVWEDTRSGRTFSAHQLYNEVKQAALREGTLTVGAAADSRPSAHSTFDMLVGAGKLQTHSFNNIRLPAFLSNEPRDIEGVRLAWVIGDSLVAKGLLTEAQLKDWIDRDASEEAAEVMAGMLTTVEVAATNDYAALLPRGSGTMKHALAHGVLALSHHQDMTQALPDYKMLENGKVDVVTPTGPLMLLYDAPAPEGVFPPKYEYIFNVNDVRFHLGTDGASNSRFPDIKDVETSFLAIADGVKNRRKTPSQVQTYVRQHEGELRDMVAQLTPAIELKEQELAETVHLQAKLEAGETGFIGWLTDSDENDAAQAKIKDLESWLDTANGLVSGCNIALRLAKSDAERETEESMRGRLKTEAQGIQTRLGPNDAEVSAWEAEIRELLAVQEEIKRASSEADRQSVNTRTDVERFDHLSKWHEDWAAWIDWLSFGISARGNMYRQGKAQRADASQYAGQVGSVYQSGEAMVRNALHPLLRETNPQYRADFDVYSRLKPAYEQLTNVMQLVQEGQRALRTAEWYIRYRDMLRMSEPTKYHSVMKTRTTTDYEGNLKTETYWEQEISPAWRSWRSQLDSAENMCMWWSSRAENKVKMLKAAIPGLKSALASAEIDDYVDPNIRDDISWFFGSWFSLGFWSYDGSQVSGIQNDLAKLEGQLMPVRGQLEPKYYEFKGRVDNAIEARRRQILTE